MVTAIGFELVRRNARMIIDRTPDDEPLIPCERTKIRLKMMRKKQCTSRRSDEPRENNPIRVNGAEIVREELADEKESTAPELSLNQRSLNQIEKGIAHMKLGGILGKLTLWQRGALQF